MPTTTIDKELINQREIARRLKYSPSYVCMVLSGERKGPKAKALILEIEDLLHKSLKSLHKKL